MKDMKRQFTEKPEWLKKQKILNFTDNQENIYLKSNRIFFYIHIEKNVQKSKNTKY